MRKNNRKRQLTPKQDHQAFLEAKYCLRVAADIMHITEKPKKNSYGLDLWPMTLKFNDVVEVVEVHVRAKFYEAKSSDSSVINNELDFGHCRLWSRISLERNGSSSRQAENGVINDDFSTFDENNYSELWSTNEKMAYDLEIK